ncbi:hypothetical protein Scep_007681 [Stephania cephalantha]|uniref:Uncharacterized protein n=1 Tax=Stephania cephalantha TaxID=152367 RepID=A0AAP0KCB2_9MAGN
MANRRSPPFVFFFVKIKDDLHWSVWGNEGKGIAGEADTRWRRADGHQGSNGAERPPGRHSSTAARIAEDVGANISHVGARGRCHINVFSEGASFQRGFDGVTSAC